MGNKRDAARAALSTVPNLHEGFHGPILAALADQGLIEPGNGGAIHAKATTRVQKVLAQAETDHALAAILRRAGAELRRVGSSIDDVLTPDGGAISAERLQNAIKNLEPGKRIEVKALFASCGLTD